MNRSEIRLMRDGVKRPLSRPSLLDSLSIMQMDYAITELGPPFSKLI